MIPSATAFLSAPDAAVIAAIVTGASAVLVATYGARQAFVAKKELKPNGGSSARDLMASRFDDLSQQVSVVDQKCDVMVGEVVKERIRAQLAEAEAAARIDRLETRD